MRADMRDILACSDYTSARAKARDVAQTIVQDMRDISTTDSGTEAHVYAVLFAQLRELMSWYDITYHDLQATEVELVTRQGTILLTSARTLLLNLRSRPRSFDDTAGAIVARIESICDMCGIAPEEIGTSHDELVALSSRITSMRFGQKQ